MLTWMSYVSTGDYERILAIVAEAASGTSDAPLPVPVLEMIRELAGCDAAAFFDGSPWDPGRRIWVTDAGLPWTEDERAVVATHRFDVPLYPSPVTLERAIRISDVMSQASYRNLELYQLAGRRHRIEYGMDYWMQGTGKRARGLRFDNAAHDFSDRTRDAIEVLGRHLRTVFARHDPGAGLDVSAQFLTSREAEIVALVTRGRTNREIGSELAISPNTVRKHLENAYLRIGVHSRAEAVAWTYRDRPALGGPRPS